MMDFTFNGISASHFGLRISSVNTYGAPERVVTEYQIPGPVPHIYAQDERKVNPYTREFQVALIRSDNLPEQTAAIKQWLMGSPGYFRLEDTYQPGVYRLARFTGDINTTWMGGARRSITFPISFSCQPQLYLKEGDLWHKIKREDGYVSMNNPTGNPAYPLIKITFDEYEAPAEGTTKGVQFLGRGINSNYVAVKENCFSYVSGKTVYIDTETEEIWSEEGENLNHAFDIVGQTFLDSEGFEYVEAYPSRTGVDADIELQPRFWRW